MVYFVERFWKSVHIELTYCPSLKADIILVWCKTRFVSMDFFCIKPRWLLTNCLDINSESFLVIMASNILRIADSLEIGIHIVTNLYFFSRFMNWLYIRLFHISGNLPIWTIYSRIEPEWTSNEFNCSYISYSTNRPICLNLDYYLITKWR